MSAPDPRVLDENLALLVGRAWEPVAPRAEFRAALRERVLARAAELRAGAALRRRRLAVAGAALLAAAASALLWVGLSGRPLDRAAILASGRVACRTPGEATWRARAATEPFGPADLPLEIATPARAAARLGGAAASARIAPGSHARAWLDPDGGAVLELLAGELALSAPAQRGADPAWRAAAGAARVGLAWGELRVAGSAERADVFLTSGEAVALGGRGPLALAPRTDGLPVGRFEGGRFVPAEPPAAAAAPSGDPVSLAAPAGPERARTAVAAEPADGAPAAGAERPRPRSALALTVLGPDGAPVPDEALAGARLSLLQPTDIPRVVDSPRAVRAEPAGRPGALAARDLPTGERWIDVAVPGYALWRGGPLELQPGVEHALEVRLERGTPVRGVVLDPDGEPVAGAWVVDEHQMPDRPLAGDLAQHEGGVAPRAETGEDGRFELPPVGTGLHVVRAAGAGWAPGWSAVFETAPGSPPVDVVVRLARGGSIEGVVHVDGGPWEGAAVLAALGERDGRQRMTYGAALTDGLGEYAIRDLAPGQYAVLLLGDEETAGVPEMRTVEVEAGGVTRVDFVRAVGGTRLSGRVTTADGAPVALMGVSVTPAGSAGRDAGAQRFGYTDGDGRYAIADLAAGAYELYLTPDQGRTVVLADAFDVPPWSAFERDVSVPAPSFAGRVLDGRTGGPLAFAGMLVFAIAEPSDPGRFVGFGLSDERGAVRLPHVAAGYYRVQAFATTGGLAPEHVEVDLPRPDGAPVELALRPGGRLEVRVRDADGAPAAGAQLSFADEAGAPLGLSERDVANGAGLFVAPAVKPGAWSVRAEGAGGGAAEGAVVVREGQTAVLELVLGP